MKKLCLGLLTAFTFILPAFGGQDATVKVVRAAHLVDVEKGKIHDNMMVWIEGDKITKVASQDTEIALPEGAEIIDLGADSYLMPGLMDSHVHLIGSPIFGYDSYQHSTARQLVYGVANAKITLEAGFTTVRNVGASGFTDVALRDAINEGDVPGPRMLVSGPALGITGGHCDENMLPYDYHEKAEGVADGPWEVRRMVRQNIKYGADMIKFCGTGGVFSKGTIVGAQQYSLEEMKAIVEEAHMAGRKVAVHAHGTEGIKSAILAGADSIEHVSYLDDEGIKLAKKHGTWFSMDIYNDDFILQEGAKHGMTEESLAKERAVGLRQRQSFERAVKAGVKMSYGTDAGVYPHGGNGKQMVKMVEWGMTPMQAVITATRETAILFGLQDRVGIIKEGMLADMVAIKGDPLADLSLFEKVGFVMKDGKVYKNTLQ
ncbi:amidohydrolase family protein [Emcibacter sp.]|uniref:Xaa-Pro dipeptidase n=1 Tax=Emcibacter sp. TaxID=1979954 RepID=UPI002AA682EE|nr:amidohydrolase family protein [Emcibacter sp.]